MARPRIAKLPTPPKHSEPHTVEFNSLEDYNNVTSQPPYTYIRGRALPQYVIALMLHELYHKKAKRYIKLYLPLEIIAQAYQYNPAAFAAVIRRQSNNPFTFVTCRVEHTNSRMRITASETKPQKASNYLGSATSLLLAEWEKHRESGGGFTLIFLFADMPRSYQNDHRVFKFRLRENLKQHTGDPTIELALQVLENGYRVSKIPSNL